MTRNYSEKSINSILDYISTSQQVNEPSSYLFSKMFSVVAQYTLDPVCYVIVFFPLSLILPPPLCCPPSPASPASLSSSPCLPSLSLLYLSFPFPFPSLCLFPPPPPSPPQSELLQWFYETTLEALQDARNDRLWFKTNTKVSIFDICC